MQYVKKKKKTLHNDNLSPSIHNITATSSWQQGSFPWKNSMENKERCITKPTVLTTYNLHELFCHTEHFYLQIKQYICTAHSNNIMFGNCEIFILIFFTDYKTSKSPGKSTELNNNF